MPPLPRTTWGDLFGSRKTVPVSISLAGTPESFSPAFVSVA